MIIMVMMATRKRIATLEEAKAYCNELHEKQIREALEFVSWEVM